jgi:hypothetical protein
MFILAANQKRGNRVLEDELFLRVGFKHDGILIKRTHVTRNLCAIQQLDGNVLPARKSYVEKRFLNVNS